MSKIQTKKNLKDPDSDMVHFTLHFGPSSEPCRPPDPKKITFQKKYKADEMDQFVTDVIMQMPDVLDLEKGEPFVRYDQALLPYLMKNCIAPKYQAGEKIGVKRSEGGKHATRPEGLLEAVKIFLKGRESYSVQKLWDLLKQKHEGRKNALNAGRYKVYFDYNNLRDLDERIFIKSPGKKPKSRSQSAFRDCVKEIQKKLK